MNMLDDILQDIPKDSCLGKAVAAGYNVFFEAETQKGPGVPQAERIDSDSVRIGDRIWMSHNLQMPADPENGIYVENGETYFTWNAAMRVAKEYGNGWRLPSRKDWGRLSRFCGGDRKAGVHLKAKTGWPGDGGLDTYGFNAIPTGYYDTLTATVRQADDGYTVFWTSGHLANEYPVHGYIPVYYRSLYWTNDAFPESSGRITSAASVRLVKDA
ncbi:MAG: hypothetical protein IKA48_01605 [Fibrobacter sp.]|nr:hypothetical protein [Fibrobacter sp.]